jgi:hypothetical protein
MGNLDNVRLGACSIVFNSVDLGHTKGGVTFKIERELSEVTVDKYGSTPVDMVLTGQKATIEVNLAESQVANLNVAVPEGDYVTGTAGSRLNLGTEAGYSLRDDAAQLTLHPAENAAGDLTGDIVFYKAVSTDSVELPFEIDNQRVFKVTFTALVDETFGNGRRLGHIGLTNIS